MKYHVTMRTVEYYGIDIEADSAEEAAEIARNADGFDFSYEDNEPWVVDEVMKIGE